MFSPFPHWLYSSLHWVEMPIGQSLAMVERLHWLIKSLCIQVLHLPLRAESFLHLWSGPALLLWQSDEPVLRRHACFCSLSQHLWMNLWQAEGPGREESTFPSLGYVNQSTASQPSKVHENQAKLKETAILASRFMNNSKYVLFSATEILLNNSE